MLTIYLGISEHVSEQQVCCILVNVVKFQEVADWWLCSAIFEFFNEGSLYREQICPALTGRHF